jgi:hypothetical protein
VPNADAGQTDDAEIETGRGCDYQLPIAPTFLFSMTFAGRRYRFYLV